jgi:hypothetical protein
MIRRLAVRCLAVLLAAGTPWALATTAAAHDDDRIPPQMWLTECLPKSGGDHHHHRAGHPERVHCLASVSNTGHYTGSYVGGGAAFRGCGRYSHEGTWGWDYCKSFIPHRPWLGWSHRRYQGGSGAYKTDGPHVPDPIGKLGL